MDARAKEKFGRVAVEVVLELMAHLECDQMDELKIHFDEFLSGNKSVAPSIIGILAPRGFCVNTNLRVRTLMHEKGISISEMARRMGILQPSLSRMLSGSGDYQTGTIEAMAEVLDVEPTELR